MLTERYDISLRNCSLYKIKKAILIELQASHDEPYSKLPIYYEIVKQTNLQSIVPIVWTEIVREKDNIIEKFLVFNKILVSFSAQFKGLIQCYRRLIGVDDTHLKGNYRGALLFIVARDGNNKLFAIAHDVVDSETTTTWSFFYHLRHALHKALDDWWAIISDRQKVT